MDISVIIADVKNSLALPPFPAVKPPRFCNGIIVRMPNHLGDAVMALPALAALKKALPDTCGLFVITPESSAQLYQALPLVDDIVTIHSPHRFYTRSERKMIRTLRAGAAILFNHSFRDAISLKLAGVPSLYGEPSRFRSIFLTGKFPFRKRKKGVASLTHQAKRYFAIARAFCDDSVDFAMPQLIPAIPPDECHPAVRALLHHPLLLTIAPGAAYGAAKRWPHQYYATVANYWIRRGGIVALVGSRSEAGICAEIKKQLPKNKVFDLCGKTTLNDLIHLFRFSAYALANDSGLMHLASASGCHGMTVFGPTDLLDTAPVGNTWKLIYGHEPCSPCLKRVCPKGNAVCMKKITPSIVLRELRKTAKELNLPLGRYFHR